MRSCHRYTPPHPRIQQLGLHCCYEQERPPHGRSSPTTTRDIQKHDLVLSVCTSSAINAFPTKPEPPVTNTRFDDLRSTQWFQRKMKICETCVACTRDAGIKKIQWKFGDNTKKLSFEFFESSLVPGYAVHQESDPISEHHKPHIKCNLDRQNGFLQAMKCKDYNRRARQFTN